MPGSFLGGVGACSACRGADAVVSGAPNGPSNGSAALSTDERTVDCARTFFVGGLLPPGVLDGVAALTSLLLETGVSGAVQCQSIDRSAV